MGSNSILDGRRILVVEDEPMIALDLQEALRDVGATVLGPAGTALKAIGVIEAGKIDCALLDIKLGEEDVSAVAMSLERRQIPMVFVTAYEDERIPRGFETRPIVHKPYNQNTLLSLIARIVTSN